MPDRKFDGTDLIAEGLKDLFQADVEAPLPPLILQLVRKLHEKTGKPEDDDAPSEPLRRKRADLFLPGARSQWWHSE